MIRLALLLLVLAEIASLVLAGQAIGLAATLLLVLLAAIAGGLLLRRQGAEALRGLRAALEGGRDPRPVLLRGGFRLVAGLLLIAPGFLGDAVALLLLLPPVQAAAAAALARRGLRVVRLTPSGAALRPDAAPRPPADPIVEAEWEELPPTQRPTHRPSGWTRH